MIPPAPTPPHPLVALTEQWLRLCQQMGAVGGGGLLAAAALLADSRRQRVPWLAEVTRASDRYLRSPVFLDLMQRNLRTLALSTGRNGPARLGQENLP